MVELTKEQEDFLRECEEEFQGRFTEKDEDFMKVKLEEPKKPPIVDPWYNTQQSSRNNYSRQNHGGDRRNRDRDRDRGRGDRDRYGDRGRGDRDRESRYGGRQQYRNYRAY